MGRLYIVGYLAARMKYCVVEPTGSQFDGEFVGSMFVAGKILAEFDSHHRAMEFIEDY